MKHHQQPKQKPGAAYSPLAGVDTNSGDIWFVAYDIREPRRLRRVHRRVRRDGVALQYSGFAVQANEARLTTLLDHLKTIIHEGVDDLRAYHLPARCQVWRLGRQAWPDGVTLTGGDALTQLLTVVDTPSNSADPAWNEAEAEEQSGTVLEENEARSVPR